MRYKLVCSMPISETYNVDVMEYFKGVEDGFFQLLIADPPYGIGYDGAKKTSGSHGGRKAHAFTGWDNERPPKAFFKEIERVSKNRIIWGANYFTEFLPPSMGWIFWRKDRGDFSSSDGELAFTSFERALRVWDKNPLILSREGGTIHPTQKPVALYKWILQNYARPGDKIFDPMMGSQSSRIAAWDMGFDYVGAEKDFDYFRDGEARFKKHVANKTTLFAPEQMYDFKQTKLEF